MKAALLLEHNRKLEVRDIDDPLPDRDEVLIRVKACGLNRLDLWTEQGALPISIPLPLIPGCEVAGEVETVGADVTDWRPRDRVTVQSNLFCGQCEFCLKGEESLCLESILLGVQRAGGFAEKVAVPARALVRLPEEVDFTTAAALTLAGSTAMHMLANRAKVEPGSWVLVMGANSGVGSAAVQIALRLGAYVIASASSQAKREFARSLGAQHVIDSSRDDWPGEVRRITQKRGVNLVIEHVGGEALAQAFKCLARGGTVVTCGATAGRHITLDLWPFFVKEQRLIGSYGRNRTDLVHTLDWAAKGILKASTHQIVPLMEINRAYDLLRGRGVLGKVIVEG